MPRTDTRRKMIESAARLFQRDGYHATSWRGLVDEAGTPWGSIHHHFPGGKEELGVAAIELGSDALAALLDHCFATTASPDAAVRRWFQVSADLMSRSGFRTGCPVAIVALETAPHSPALAAASRQAFERWERSVTARLEAAGISRARAGELARILLALLEGALLLSRVYGSTSPLARAGAHAAELIQAELAKPRRRRKRARG